MIKMPRSWIWRYGVAVLAVLLPVCFSLLLRRFEISLNLTWLLVGLLLFTGWYCGHGPGLLTAFLYELIINYFSPPIYTIKYNITAFNRFGVLVLMALLASSRRQAEERLKARARQQAAVAQFGQQALASSTGTSLFLLLHEAAVLAAQQVEAEYAGVWELLSHNQMLQLRAGSGWKEKMVGNVMLDADATSPIGFSLLSREPVMVTDLNQERRFTSPELLNDHQVISGGNVIIPGNDQPFGVLSIYSTKRRKFSEDDINFLQAIANVLAEAIARRRAEEEIRKLNEELEQRVIERTSQLEAANKELEAFSYSVSHDLRAPLRAIHGFSRILLDEFATQLPDEAQDHLQLVSTNAKQMGHLIDDLLSFSRLSRQPLNKQSLAPANLARQVVEELRRQQANRNISVSIADLPICECDPALLKQVFVNLLTNALKFTSQREQTIIEIGNNPNDELSGASIYYVKDNGVGFDMQFANKLFGVFQRLHRTEEYEGTGVGLAIVERIIHRHGGRVWAEAELDRGATFYFTLAGENHE